MLRAVVVRAWGLAATTALGACAPAAVSSGGAVGAADVEHARPQPAPVEAGATGAPAAVDAAAVASDRGKPTLPALGSERSEPSVVKLSDAPVAPETKGPTSSDAGSEAPVPAHGPCPEEMALVGRRVCVDRWEAALVLVLPDGTEEAWSPFKSPPRSEGPVGRRGGVLRAVSRPKVVPQGYVSGAQAERACRAAGKRLCAPAEWEMACRGPADTTFPYGETRERGVCNGDGRAEHPVMQAFPTLHLPEDRMWHEGMDNPLINQLPHTVTRTGEMAGCTNGYGTYDMVGNLHEWVDDPRGTFRGGFYMDTKINGDGCDYATTAHPFDYHDYSTGFRCCLDPDGP